jgi:archaellum component FlaC
LLYLLELKFSSPEERAGKDRSLASPLFLSECHQRGENNMANKLEERISNAFERLDSRMAALEKRMDSQWNATQEMLRKLVEIDSALKELKRKA